MSQSTPEINNVSISNYNEIEAAESSNSVDAGFEKYFFLFKKKKKQNKYDHIYVSIIFSKAEA